MARTGTEIMIEKLIKMLGIDPQIIMGKVDEIRKAVLNAGGDLAALRRDQIRIMEKLQIPLEPETNANDRPADCEVRKALN